MERGVGRERGSEKAREKRKRRCKVKEWKGK
jgi:hypothetical protein